VLKSIGTLEDVERMGEFNGIIHGDPVNAMTRILILDHPYTRPDHFIYVEDESTGRIVSSICLIPWRWRYEDVDLKSGEMGICGTLPDYRNRGLVRALMKRHKALLRENDCDLSHIQGIPYFYRQFGYEYAMPLEGGWRVENYQPPTTPPEFASGYTFRQATLDDIPVLKRLYDEAAYDLSISAFRDEAEWAYLMGPGMETEPAAETWFIMDPSGQIAGYWRIALLGFGDGLNISEVSRLSSAAAVALLCQLRQMAIERNKPHIRLNIHQNSSLMQMAVAWKSNNLGTYAWQMHIPDVARLLLKIAPVLERRLASSPFAGLTQTIRMNLYRETIEINFSAGKLIEAKSIGFTNEGDFSLPPLLFAPLVLGYRSREELSQNYPDVGIWDHWRYLVDVLFPKMQSFIYTIY
jgi:GNAT superfamily N-acetyltransferase